MPTVSMPRLGLSLGLSIFAAWLCFAPRECSAQDAAPRLSALEKDPTGWIDLLAKTGPNLEGWVRGPIPPPPKGQLRNPSQWKIDPITGYLVCQGDGGHDWIRWDEKMGDAIFHVEFRYRRVEGKKGYNSGIYARNSADASIWHQVQIGDRSGGYLFGETPGANGKPRFFNTSRAGSRSMVRPAGEWNTVEITCKGPNMTAWTNGVETAVLPDCGAARGYVGLEAEGYRIEFRNVRVKPLTERKGAGQ